MPGLRLLCIGCSNYSPLARALRPNPDDQTKIDFHAAPFGQVFPSLLGDDPALWQPAPDFTLVWTQPQNIFPAFAQLLDGLDVDWTALAAQVDDFTAALIRAAERTQRVLLATTWALPAEHRGSGCADWSTLTGLAPTLARMNLRLAEACAGHAKILLLDAARWLQAAGPQAFDAKLWLMGKTPFGLRVFEEVASDVRAALAAVLGQTRKAIVLDLDNTLWGGIVGDDGWEALELGGHSPLGEAFSEFQRALRTLQRRGIVLALCSKNEERVALEAIDRHPEMLLRRDDFVAWRINWQDKAENVKSLADELNLGLKALVFIDDSPAERARVREAWPEVFVPEWPADPAQYARALRNLRCFDTLRLTDEDRARTSSYVAERQRREVRQIAATVEDWLARLELRVQTSRLSPADLPRAAQLLNKTNQFNLTTRRLSEAEFQTFAQTPGQLVYTYRVSDRFGAYGLTGLASLQIAGDTATIVDFILSCRVMGRHVERVMLNHLAEEARRAGCQQMIGQYIATAKNQPCAEFLSLNGFRALDGNRWGRPLTEPALGDNAIACELASNP